LYVDKFLLDSYFHRSLPIEKKQPKVYSFPYYQEKEGKEWLTIKKILVTYLGIHTLFHSQRGRCWGSHTHK